MNVINRSDDGRMIFECPGCGLAHGVYVDREQRPRWDWNGDMVRPTFSPSILVRGTEMTAKGRADYETWYAAGCPSPAPSSFESKPSVCHSYVRDGQIQFLGDCTHKLAGQTVPLPPIDD